MIAAIVVTTCAYSFLFPIPGVPHSPHSTSVPRPAVVPRSRSPLAFDGHDDAAELARRLHAGADIAAEDATLSSSDTAVLSSSEARRVDVFERVSPAVAFIQTSVDLNGWFNRRGEYPAGAGSGFVWDAAGHVVTNYHVVAGNLPGLGGKLPRKVKVSLYGGAEQVLATVVGFEADKDIAVLKIDPKHLAGLKPLELARSSDLRPGQDVLAIGNPFGLDYTLTRGIVSALGRDVDGAGGRPIKDCIQTDAAINPGNSGGPLLDSSGRLIGVNTMIYAPNGVGGNVGIGFAIPVDTVARVVNQIIRFGPNARPSLGVSLLDDSIRKQYARSLRRPLEGALIVEVVPRSPADGLGLSACRREYGGILLGDLITAVNGKAIKQNEDLMCAVEEAEPDESITLTVMRACDPEHVEELEITPVARRFLSKAR